MGRKTLRFKFRLAGEIQIQLDPEKVFVPSEFSKLLANNLKVRKGDLALDIGCGAGILAIVAAKIGASKVFAIDINPYAVETTIHNAHLNRVDDKVIAIVGDTFDPVKNTKFDIIFSNPPQTPIFPHLEPKIDWIGKALFAGYDGRAILDKIIDESKHHLIHSNKINRTGKLQLATTSIIDFKKTMEKLAKNGFDCYVLAKKNNPFRNEYYKVLPLIEENFFVRRGNKLYETIYLTCSRLIGPVRDAESSFYIVSK